MKFIKSFKLYEKSEDEFVDTTELEKPAFPHEFPIPTSVSVRKIFNKFKFDAKKSIWDNPQRFAKIAKKVFYSPKGWENYFNNKQLEKARMADQKGLELFPGNAIN